MGVNRVRVNEEPAEFLGGELRRFCFRKPLRRVIVYHFEAAKRIATELGAAAYEHDYKLNHAGDFELADAWNGLLMSYESDRIHTAILEAEYMKGYNKAKEQA